MLDTLVTLDGNLLSTTLQDAQFQWIDCSTILPIADADQSTFYPLEEGSYAVQLERSGCIAISGCHHAPGDPDLGISIHPDPTNEMLVLLAEGLNDAVIYRLIDAGGRMVREGDITTNSQNITIAGLSPGGYILHVIDGRTNKTLGTIKVMVK